MMESVALPGGGGTKAAVRDYRVAVKTGTAKKIGPDGKYIDKYVAYTAGVAPASRPQFALVVGPCRPLLQRRPLWVAIVHYDQILRPLRHAVRHDACRTACRKGRRI